MSAAAIHNKQKAGGNHCQVLTNASIILLSFILSYTISYILHPFSIPILSFPIKSNKLKYNSYNIGKTLLIFKDSPLPDTLCTILHLPPPSRSIKIWWGEVGWNLIDLEIWFSIYPPPPPTTSKVIRHKGEKDGDRE